MTASEKKRDLALYRLKEAEESLDEAQFLFKGEKSSRSVINRAYYAMFYSVLALFIFEPYSSSKHSGVLSYFNRRFIKGELLSAELGRAINKAFDLTRMFHELPSRDRGEECATGQPQGVGSEAYLNSTSQGPSPEDAPKDGHIRGRSRRFLKFPGQGRGLTIANR